MANILILDDDKMVCDTLSNVLKCIGHDVTCAFTLDDGLRKATSGAFDVVFLDVWMPDGNGLDVLPRLKEVPLSPEIVIITGEGDPDGAELAIKNGAWDYIEKPASTQDLILSVTRALQYREEKEAGRPAVALKRAGIIGSSRQMTTCLELLAQAAGSDANVLITGETGTGKELFARAIHANSHCANRNFVVVDCAALPETLVESVLFGHERGAFTGADKTSEGLIRQAHEGTLFLDEVGELPRSLQKALLRVLQEHRFRPVGAKLEVVSNFRLAAATNRDLDEMVRRGQFRNDLLFRLRSITIELPPLREREGDMTELAVYHTARVCKRYGMGIKGFSPEFFEALGTYEWPGNVRELLNALESALAAAGNEPTLFPVHLPTQIRIKLARASVSKKIAHKGIPRGDTGEPLPRLQAIRQAAIAEAEQQYLQDLMLHTGADIEKVCEVSGLRRSRFYELLKKYNISKF